MANEPDDDQRRAPPTMPDDVLPDAPNTGSALVLSQDEATALALRMAGESLPNECRFHCIMCGWNKTLQFKEAEIEALDGDITSYGGPCSGCGSMTLVPYHRLAGDHGQSILEQARANKREDAEINADVLVDKVKTEIAVAMGGPPAEDTDQPDDDTDPGDLKGRSEG